MLQRIVVPDLSGGVSRQPDGQRFPNQMENATNVSMHLATGLERRLGSEMLFQTTNISGALDVHWIDRSASQRYVVIFHEHASTPIHIRKVDGTACTITYPGGAEEVAIKAYLNTPSGTLRYITIDDTTIVVNTTVVTALSSSTQTYQFAGTDVDRSSNAHNKASWDGFDLPPTAINEYWYAKDDALGHSAGWYKSISTTTQPWYERQRTPMANSTFDGATMPIRIVQTSDTAFSVSYCPWKPRYSGDSQTNPGPTFVGKPITDLCVHRNRLWFSAGENVCGSVSGSFYDFWLDSYTTVIDSDPIDVKLSSAQVTKINWMAPFQRTIVVFTESGQQYEIRAQNAMTPSTVSILPSTSYKSPNLRPNIVGSQLYWVASKGPWGQVYEYLTDDSKAQTVAIDTASHIDGYLPSTISELRSSTANDLLFLLDSSNNIYVNYMFWQGEKKLQNSWCKWTIEDTVLGTYVFDDSLYILKRVTTSAGSILRMDLIDLRSSDAYPSYTPRMDSIDLITGSWNSVTKTTTFNIPFNVSSINTVYLGPQWGNQEGSRYSVVSVTNPTTSSTLVTVNGKLDSYPCYIGKAFDSEVKLSRQYIRDQSGVPAVGSLQLKQITIYHRNTGFFEFVVDPKTEPASDRVYTYTGKQLGTIGFKTSTNVISDRDSHNFKIMASSGGVDLKLRSNSPAPFNITGLEFVADFVPAKRSAAST